MSFLPTGTLNSPEKLCEYLVEAYGIPEDAANILRAEQVDGETLPLVTEDDLRNLNIRLGPIKKIMNIISSLPVVVKVPHINVEDPLSGSSKENDQWNTTTIVDVPNVNPKIEILHHQSQQKNMCFSPNITFTADMVKQWVTDYDQKEAKDSDQNLLMTQLLEGTQDSARKKLVKIACAKLAEITNDFYPHAEVKEEVAKSIVEAFPKLRSTFSENGYEHFYDRDSASGYLEYRFKTIRKHLDASSKRRVSLNNKGKVNTAKAQRKEITNKEIILGKIGAEGDFKSVTDILRKYPRFKEMNGELIRRDFLALMPDEDKFLDKFSSFFAPRILAYASKHRNDLLQKVSGLNVTDDLKALALLPEILPTPNYLHTKKRKTTKMQPNNITHRKDVPNKSLLQFVRCGEDILKVTKPTAPAQPFLICITEMNPKTEGSFFIRVDSELIPIERNAMEAFDIMFKLHYCFNVKYAPELINFYNFIAGCIHNLEKPRSCCTSLFNILSNMTLDEIEAVSTDAKRIKREVF